MKAICINSEVVMHHYAGLNSIGSINADLKNGFLRAPYSEAESEAIAYIEQAAIDGGLLCRRDLAGNLIAETPGTFSEWVETGSHIDTVPGGGNFDGAAGVISGLEALLAIHHSGTALKRGLRLRVWRGEESATYGVTSIGSKAAFGALNPAALQQTYEGQSLAEAMREQGVDPETVRSGLAAMPDAERDGITAFLELHIEQGKVLETADTDIGIVSAIRGSKRSWITVSGTFDHSGATPMGVEFRQDANLAMAYMLVELDQLLHKANAEGVDLVQTSGLINPSAKENSPVPLLDNAVTKVSGAAHFSFEVRGCSAPKVDRYCDQAFEVIRETAARFGVSVEIDTFSDQAGIEELDSEIQRLLDTGCTKLGLSHLSLPSGAWHDAGTVAEQLKSNGSPIPVGMIFIPCRRGISHSPDELSSPEQITKGASLLATAMAEIASNYRWWWFYSPPK
ncbi:N-carbamoyl-L-amino-acid hydrolase [Mariprofundus aestuarium]|uniref:N-carbamoyl-L-amino-acid hydrolase n=1 Tax=Mariprofundus aestuarium TaxID=1921086 RepID=A0A2K8KZ90_MARES|nr:hydantoinase/carbamoylase family amidase [Mariprofundus aestuarium]ATX80340.1 N-carbamoyl-L-amino-acid hydrolase [Mariprofundus aestuarium]